MRRLLLLIAFLATIGVSYAQNYAAVLTGSNYLTVPTSPIFEASSVTMSMWIKPTSFPNTWNTLFCSRNGWGTSGTRYSLAIKNVSGSYQYNFYDGVHDGYLASPAATVVPLNKWTNVVVVMTSSYTRLYVDGVDKGVFLNEGTTTNFVRGTATGLPFSIGGWSNGECFSGSIDEVSFWNRVLTAAEIQANVTTPPTTPQSNLYGYWKFDDMITASSSTTGDYSGNGRTASFTALTASEKVLPSVTLASTSGANMIPAGTSTSLKVDASALLGSISKVELYAGTTKIDESAIAPCTFNVASVSATIYSAKVTDNSGGTATSTSNVEGVQVTSNSNFATQGPVTVPANNAFRLTNGGTISVWICPGFSSALTYNPGIISCQSSSQRYYDFELCGTTTDGVLTNLGFYNGAWKKVAYTFTSGRWYNVTYVLKSADVDVYVNGSSVGSFGQGMGTGTLTNFNIGAQYADGSNPFVGGLDEVKVWSVQKTPDEILEMYKTQKTDYMNLEGYWRFNDLASVATDYSGNGRNGTYITKSFVKLPSVKLTSPTTTTFTPGTSVALTSSLYNVTSGTVEYYNNGTILNSLTVSPFSYSMSTSASANTNIDVTSVLNYTTTGLRVADKLSLKNTTLPSISITNTTNQVYPLSGIPVTVSATAGTNAIAKVDFYVSTTTSAATIVGTSTVSPYNFTYTNITAGTSYFIKAVATDNAGNSSTSDAIVARANQYPSISATTPTAVQAIERPVTMTVTPTDADGTVSRVVFYVNGAAVSTITTSPYTLSYTAPVVGVYTLNAIVYDNLEASATTSTYTVTVKNAPTVVFTTASASFANPTSIALEVTANTNTTTSVSKVAYYGNWASLGAVSTTSPYSFNWNSGLTVGAKSIIAIVTDADGLTGTSAPITITVTTANPVVNVLSVTQSSTLFKAPSAKAIVTATAIDNDGSVSKVSLYDGTTLVKDAMTANGSVYSFEATNLSAGVHTFRVVATDNYGATGEASLASSAVAENVIPALTLTASSSTIKTIDKAIIIATASDDDGLAKIELYRGATLVNTTTTTNTTSGICTFELSSSSAATYTLTAIATDVLGASNTATVVVVINVNQAPVITVTSSSATYLSSKGFSVTITATDADGTITKVELYKNGTYLGVITGSTYDFTTQAIGTCVITAVATDNNGAVTTSAKLNIVIKKDTEVPNVVADLAVKFYPNPFKNILNVELEGAFEYTIVDLKGSVVEKGIARDRAELGSKIQSGFYLLNIRQNGASKTLKIEKQ